MRLPAYTLCCLVVGVLVLASPGTARGGNAPEGALTLAALENQRFANPSYSPDGNWIAMSDGGHNALYLCNVTDNTTTQIASSPSGGYAYNWSPDSTKLGFKLLVPTAGSAMPLQVPVVFNVGKKTMIALSTAVQQAGVPSFAATGQIAFTIGQELRIANRSGKTLQTFLLDHYANLTPIAPNGTMVAYNDLYGRICVIDLGTGVSTPLTADEDGYFNPVWSPDSNRLVVSTIAGVLRTIEVSTGALHELGEGFTPSWGPDSKTVFFNKVDRLDGIQVNREDICQAQFDGSGAVTLTQDNAIQSRVARVAADGSKIVFVSPADGELYQTPLLGGNSTLKAAGAPQDASPQATPGAPSLGQALKLSSIGMPMQELTASAPIIEAAKDTLSAEPAADAGKKSLAIAPTTDAGATPDAVDADQHIAAPLTIATNTVVNGTVPYLHQVYDTPDNFDGNWACNATSAAMCLAYVGKIGYWDVTCCCPSSHVSHYGRYISQVYTNNGYTYNIGSPDASGVTAWGGYGYIVRNNWADTKGYMRDYFNNHGDTSSVDWSPTFAKLQTEINASHPFVVLNTLTTAGHYIVAKGYVNGQYVGYFNDPYGNKNTGYMNYNGNGVYYDWPGYNYGHSNLNTVPCIIYSRANPPSTWNATYNAQSYPSSMAAGATATVWAEFNNTGTGHWTHSNTYLGTSSPQDRDSAFCTSGNWANCHRPSDVDQSDVANGQVGRFTFILTAPGTPGTYTEKFKLVQEGVTWFGPEITWTITVTGSDTTAPSVPSGLTATAASTSQINLSWTASTDNVGVTGYKIYRNGSYLTSVTGTSYSNTGLAMGTTYSYTVSAYDAASNESAQSAAKDETTWIIVDNADAGFSASANWSTGTSSTDKYGTNYRFRSTAAISDQAVWAFTIPTTDNYEVYAWWSVGANRSTTAPYSVNGGSGIPKNQQANGGTWNSLGTFSMAAGSNNVKLSCWTTSGYVVIADAVRLVRR